MKLSDLTISDLSTLMSHLSRRMSKLSDRTPENTALWERLAFMRGCTGTEFTRRLEAIEFPTGKRIESEADRSNWLANRLSELIPVEDRGKASDIIESHLKHFDLV